MSSGAQPPPNVHAPLACPQITTDASFQALLLSEMGGTVGDALKTMGLSCILEKNYKLTHYDSTNLCVLQKLLFEPPRLECFICITWIFFVCSVWKKNISLHLWETKHWDHSLFLSRTEDTISHFWLRIHRNLWQVGIFICVCTWNCDFFSSRYQPVGFGFFSWTTHLSVHLKICSRGSFAVSHHFSESSCNSRRLATWYHMIMCYC
jgi:hypothetical protein